MNNILEQFISLLDEYKQYDSFEEYCSAELNVNLFTTQQRKVVQLLELEKNGSPKYPFVGITAGHGVGKTFLAACLVFYWLDKFKPNIVIVTTAPTFRQVSKLLWAEIKQLYYKNPKLQKRFRLVDHTLFVTPKCFATGLATDDPQKFQGFHAPVIKIIIDEANGFPENLWQSAFACLTNANAQIFCIGNPIQEQGTFYDRTVGYPPGTGWLSCLEHPNVVLNKTIIPGAVSKDWVNTFMSTYSHLPSVIDARVRGIWPKQSLSDNIIPIDRWVNCISNLNITKTTPLVLGADIARYGINKSVCFIYAGQKLVEFDEWGKTSLDNTTERIVSKIEKYGITYVAIDDAGLGGGVTDFIRRKVGEKVQVEAYYANAKPIVSDKCTNLATEVWLFLLELINNCGIELLNNENLRKEITSRKLVFNTSGKATIEGKQQFMARTKRESPDYSDAFIITLSQLLKLWTYELNGEVQE